MTTSRGGNEFTGGEFTGGRDELVDVVVIGAGFAGIGAAAELKRRRIDNVVILERASEVGGVWRDNTYPGCRCDIPSSLYSFSFMPKPDWSDRFATQPEIKQYLVDCVRRLGIESKIRFDADVASATWDGESLRWIIAVRDGRTFAARMLIVGSGALNEPAIPDLPGLDSFDGDVFHSAQWPADFDATGRNVVVVGTGATAVQVVPQIAAQTERLTVVQRTAPWIVPRGDRAVPAWLQATYGRFPATQSLARTAEYYRRELLTNSFAESGRLLRLIERTGNRHIARQVRDPELRRAVTPNFRAGCKRVLMSDDWYPTLQRPDVDLVVAPITAVTPTSVTFADESGGIREVLADTLILATGFHVQHRSILARIRGASGQSMAAAMGSRRPAAYLGSTISGFPNLVLMTGPNTGLANNSMVVMIEAQATYAGALAEQVVASPERALDVLPTALDDFIQELDHRLAGSVWEAGGCMSWYQDGKGRVTALWPGTTTEFRRRTRELDLRDYQVVPPGGRN